MIRSAHRLTLFVPMISLNVWGANSDDYVKELNSRLSTVWYQCPAKIWSPNLKVKPQAFIKDPKFGGSWILNENGIKGLPQVPPNLKSDFKFDNSVLGGRPTISVNLGKTLDRDTHYKGGYAFYLIVHEGFHWMFQNGDWAADKEVRRGDLFPGDANARYYRAMTYQNLKEALLGQGGNQALGKAAFWYQKWKKKFPIETQLSVDRLEGSAMYYDIMAVAFSFLGCQANSQGLLAFLKENAGFFFESPENLNSEGYQIGSLSSIILYLKGSTDWQNRTLRGESPADILLASIQPINDMENKSYYRDIVRRVNRSNSEVANDLHGDLENFNSDQYVKVLIPQRFDIERFPVADILVPNAMPEAQVWVVDDGYATAGTTGQYAKATGLLSLFSEIKSPCSMQGQFGLIERNLLVTQGRIFSGKNQYWNFRVQGKQKRLQGLDWICTGE